MSSKASITSIAKQTGVSFATVSRALNSPEKVKAETLQKIRSEIARRNYKPRVVSNKLNTVSLLIPDHQKFSDEAIINSDNNIVQNIINLLNKTDMQLIVSTYEKIVNLPEVFRNKVIAFLHGDGHKDYVEIINMLAKETTIAVINDTNDILDENVYQVCSDHAQGIRLAMKHISERGHKKIGFISNVLNCRGRYERLSAYTAFMQEHHSFSSALVFTNTPDLIPQSLKRICENGATAILVSCEELTPRVLYYLKTMNLSVPDDISVVTGRHSPGRNFYFPELTELVQPIDRLSELAIEILLDEPPHGGHFFRKIPYSLRNRESVKYI